MKKFKDKTILNAICQSTGMTHLNLSKKLGMKYIRASSKAISALKLFKMLQLLSRNNLISDRKLIKITVNYIKNTNFDVEINKITKSKTKNNT